MTTAPANYAANEQPLNLFWFLPTGGDGPYLGSTIGHRLRLSYGQQAVAVGRGGLHPARFAEPELLQDPSRPELGQLSAHARWPV